MEEIKQIPVLTGQGEAGVAKALNEIDRLSAPVSAGAFDDISVRNDGQDTHMGWLAAVPVRTGGVRYQDTLSNYADGGALGGLAVDLEEAVIHQVRA